MKRTILTLTVTVLCATLLPPLPAGAKQYTLLGKPLNLFGFASQSAQISAQEGNRYHVEEGLQQALFTLFAEADYRPSSELTFYMSGLLTMDLAYELKHDDRSWNEKGFSASREEMFIDDQDWQLLKEAHITWAPGSFMFRIGKQIVSWGEMDFFRIMDQINPIDDRRGFSDVEFETTIIPIYLFRGEWWPQIDVGWMEELGIQFIFNPNAMFIPNLRLDTGNAHRGIWSAAAELDNPVLQEFCGMLDGACDDPAMEEFLLGVIGSTSTVYVGEPDEAPIIKPDRWDDDGFEYGVRLSLLIQGSLLTLNGFYGRENSAQLLIDGFSEVDPLLTAISGETVPAFGEALDGTSVLLPRYSGYYPRQKSVGVTWTGDLPLGGTGLGGVDPLLRVEVRYQFDKVFADADQAFYVESDYLDTGLGIDWKVKIPFLNPRAYFTVSGQFLYARIMDYPDDVVLNDVDDSLLPDEDYYTTTLMLSTSYLNGKLIPQVAGAYLFNNEASLILASLSYIQSYRWHYSLEAAFLDGKEPNVPLWLFRHNDYLAVKVKFNWG